MSQTQNKTFRGYSFTFSNGIWKIDDEKEQQPSYKSKSKSTYTLDEFGDEDSSSEKPRDFNI